MEIHSCKERFFLCNIQQLLISEELKMKKIAFWLLGLICFIHEGYSEEISKKALIFGVTGQDGAYLAEFLLGKNYRVYGVYRRSSTRHTERLEALLQQYQGRFTMHYGDLGDDVSIRTLIQVIRPDEVYNLAAQSHVHVSFKMPVYTSEVNGIGTLRILEAIRGISHEKKIRFYQASTSELFGKAHEIPQVETTPFHPRSPYGVSKLFAYWITVNYRESYGVYACNGILFNHESPLREETFVTRKITLAACKQKAGSSEILEVGNLDAQRDWGYAKDYVEAMWLMLQQDQPEDYVIATGQTHTVREFINTCYEKLGIDIKWHGTGVDEYGVDAATGQTLVKVNAEFYRPCEVEFLLGNAEKAFKALKWKPNVSFEELVQIMVEADLKKVMHQSMDKGVEKNRV